MYIKSKQSIAILKWAGVTPPVRTPGWSKRATPSNWHPRKKFTASYFTTVFWADIYSFTLKVGVTRHAQAGERIYLCLDKRRKSVEEMENCSFHSQLLSVMEVLAKAAVAEINRRVDDSCAVLRLEVSQSRRDIDLLQRKCEAMEAELRRSRMRARRKSEGHG